MAFQSVRERSELGATLIQAGALTKVYRTEKVETKALDCLDLAISKGEFVAVMGPSGCGKSTLLSILGLLDRPTSGSLVVFGQEVATHTERQRTHLRRGSIGFVFQGFNLIETMSIAENVELPLAYLRLPSSERHRLAKEAMERVMIDHRRDHYPAELSGGQQQRAAIARAIVASPQLILADEPTGNLDSRNGTKILELLCGLNQQGTTVVMVTHSPDQASLAGRTVHLFDGKLVTGDGENVSGAALSAVATRQQWR